MYQESRFNPKATNKNKNGSVDKSYMQLNSNYHAWQAELIGKKLSEFDPFDPYDNIHAGIAILNDYRHYWISQGVTSQEKLFQYMLNSFNAGINGYKKMGLISRSYDRKILEYKTQLEIEGGI